MSAELLFLCGAFFLAFAVQSAIGFGSAIIAISIGAFVLPLARLLPPIIILNIVLCTAIVVRHPRDVDWGMLLRRIVPLMGVGLPVGLYIFSLSQDDGLKRAFGVFVVLVAAWELYKARRDTGLPRPLPAALSRGLLFTAGVLHGMFATGGPLAVFVAGRDLPQKERFRATLLGLWICLNIFMVASFAATDRIDAVDLRRSAVLSIPLVAGIFAGEWLHSRINPKLFRTAVYVLLLVSGVALAFR